MLIEKYKYCDYRVPNPKHEGRFYYQVPGQGRLPGVTKILSATKSAEDIAILEEWRQRVGEEEADRITKQSATLGKSIHSNMENYVIHGTKPTGNVISKLLSNIIIRDGLPKLSEIWGIEAQIYYSDLWFGIVDCVGIHDGEPAIIDFKNSRKDKKREWIEDYFLQLAAYAEAHNNLYGTNIQKGVVMMALHDGKYREFIIEGDEMKHYQQKWLNKVYDYYANLN